MFENKSESKLSYLTFERTVYYHFAEFMVFLYVFNVFYQCVREPTVLYQLPAPSAKTRYWNFLSNKCDQCCAVSNCHWT